MVESRHTSGGDAGVLLNYGTTGKYRVQFFGVGSRKFRVYADHATTNGDWRTVDALGSISGWNFIACARVAVAGAQPTVWLAEGP